MCLQTGIILMHSVHLQKEAQPEGTNTWNRASSEHPLLEENIGLDLAVSSLRVNLIPFPPWTSNEKRKEGRKEGRKEIIQYWKEKEKEGEDGDWKNKDKNVQEDKRKLEGRNENGQMQTYMDCSGQLTLSGLGLDEGFDEQVCGLCVEREGVAQGLQIWAFLQEGFFKTNSSCMEVLLQMGKKKGWEKQEIQLKYPP
ncbi:hypothetical protein L345_08360, partial [Ophiophagus hannah]